MKGAIQPHREGNSILCISASIPKWPTMIFPSLRGLALVIGSVGAALMVGACNSSKPKDAVPPDTLVQERDTMPPLDSLGMRKAILGLWRADTTHSIRGLQDWPGGSVQQILIEPFPDRKDPTVRRMEKWLVKIGHKPGPCRSPTAIMADIRVRVQRADSSDIDTLLVIGTYYPAEHLISGTNMGGGIKGSADFQLEAMDRLNFNSYRYRRVP